MENNFRDKQQKNYILARMARDIVMAILYLTMSVFLFFGDKWKIEQIMALGTAFSYFFGSICLLYGGYRLYRGIKRDY
jgi:hypothetical protein